MIVPALQAVRCGGVDSPRAVFPLRWASSLWDSGIGVDGGVKLGDLGFLLLGNAILLIPAYFLAWLANRIQRVRPEQPSAEGAH